ncbi:MAG TPA: TAXI family TRAP transporter solute-binding subunit [Vicinamibacterales bacterium]|nr:TAXI family TRAP transporter solute-binding subunit [Vicinamibacterales bacterium]
MVRARFLVVCVVAGALVISCTGSQGSEHKRRLSIATGGTGGVFYPYGGGIAKIISESLPGVEATVEVTAASIDNLKFLKQGTSDIAFTMADIAEDALEARDAFTSFGAVPLRTLGVLYSSYTHLVVNESSGITSVAQLKGRVVSVGAAGSGTTTLALRILQAAGLDPKRDVRRQNLGVAQSVDAMKDGKIDAFFWNGGIPTASVLDLVNTPGMSVRFISTDDLIPRLEQMYGRSLYYREIIPRATYKMDADSAVVAVANHLVVSDTMAEQLAYDITRLLFDKQPELATIHPQARTLKLQSAVKGSPIPYHPGAIRFYRERNVWTE